jgi:hypothetical protein
MVVIKPVEAGGVYSPELEELLEAPSVLVGKLVVLVVQILELMAAVVMKRAATAIPLVMAEEVDGAQAVVERLVQAAVKL